MRVRHKIPSIFNLSMVDVLCCALGCVILLWLINLREAKHHQDSAAQTSQELSTRLAGASADLNRAYAQLADLKTRLDASQKGQRRLQGQLADEQAAHARLDRQWTTSQQRVRRLEADLSESHKQTETLQGQYRTALASADRLEKDLSSSRKQTARLQQQYRDAVAESAQLERKLKDSAESMADLREELRASARKHDMQAARTRTLSGDLDKAGAELKELQGDLKTARSQYTSEHALAEALEADVMKKKAALSELEKKIEGLQAAGKDLERQLATARGYRTKWEASEQRLEAAQAELEKTRQGLTTLESEKKDLKAQAQRVRTAAANRFAGITLTGRRVIFLVDHSGSMKLVDEKTPAPHKWTEVANTVARVMRSMPDLERFQVIVFAENASFLLGHDNEWLRYDPRTSPDQVVRALSGTEPDGGTNLYAALQTAFGMRSAGLDTIYVLSDGLPNVGEGLDQERTPVRTDTERTIVLARYLRNKLRQWNRPDTEQRRVRINTIGFFFESPDVGAFLWALAREHDGSFVGMSSP